MADEMEIFVIVAKQKALAEELEKASINFKKDSDSRKTQRYKEERLKKIQEIWREFESNHNKIKENVKQDTPYIQRNTYGKVEQLYKELKTLLENIRPSEGGATSLQPSKSSDNTLQTQRLKKLNIKIEAIIGNVEEFEETFPQYSSQMYEYQQKILLEQLKNMTELHEDFMSSATEEDMKTTYVKSKRYNDIKRDINQCLHRMASALGKSQEGKEKEQSDSKLPPLKIPTFKGNYLEWRSFADIFSTIIHKKSSLSTTEKMEYLKTHLEGEPMQLIQHLTISSANYECAWETLRARYDNERKIVSMHIDKMLRAGHQATQSTANSIKAILDATKEGLSAINNMGFNTKSWDPIIVHLVTKALDQESRNLFEQSLEQPNKMPSLQTLYDFLARRYQALDVLSSNKQRHFKAGDDIKHVTRNVYVSMKPNCVFCQGEHNIYSCRKFMCWTPKERYEQVRATKLCVNCLRHDKQIACMSKNKCKYCNKKHHSLLHLEKVERRHSEQSRTDAQIQSNHGHQRQNILLATAIVRASDITEHGQCIKLRALIDQGSQATLVTEAVAQILRLKKQKVYVEVSGLGATDAGTARNKVELTISPRFSSDFKVNVEALVLPKLTRTLPDEEANNTTVGQFKTIKLADPTFNIPGGIDLIIGADVYGDIILDGLKKEAGTSLIAQNSQLGWLISGRTSTQRNDKIKINGLVVQTSLEKQLERFWDIEEVSRPRQLKTSDQECEDFYHESHFRDKEGRYIVKIPFKQEMDHGKQLGESKNRAIARLRQLENKFSTNKELKAEYVKVMNEFVQLGHMVEVPKMDKQNSSCYYLPHHAVLKPDSTTTKLRVVFDGSAKTSSGVSLNQLMMVGPRLQEDITTIIMRWRTHKYVFTADIEKMYRQIKINSEHQDYQRILWRSETNQPIKEYKLTTVTYGTASAPYLAVRTLQQLATDEQQRYPIASEIVKNDFYVDDVLAGGDTLKECKEAQHQLVKLLKGGGFHLRKWAANHKSLLESIVDARNQPNLNFDKEEIIKTLGMHWNPSADTFQFKVHITTSSKEKHRSTKRATLSEIARLFDPLGWLTPVTITAKVLMQRIWKAEIDWDEPLTDELQQCWDRFRHELPNAESIKIPRWIGTNKGQKIELHGFCDASEGAYAAVVYARTTKDNTEYRTTLLTSKTRVAPIKNKLTTPKLELCGAHLLSKLLKEVKQIFGAEIVKVFAWTDSTIVLSWIRRNASNEKIFIASRVSQIRETTDPKSWRHIRSAENPADCASRGLTPAQLNHHSLWWNGPEWLNSSIVHWPVQSEIEQTISATQPVESRVVLTSELKRGTILDRFSSYTHLIRTTAYCKRFVFNCTHHGKDRRTGELTFDETEEAKRVIVLLVQLDSFPEEMRCLNNGDDIPKRSKLLSLNPRLDHNKMLVVGGRLEHASIISNEKHPYILPYNNVFTKLLAEHVHQITLHGGINLTMATLRQSYWIPHAKRLVRKIVHSCVRCYRFNASPKQQIMGMLPSPRVTPSRPFTHSGVDYAGPLQIRMSKGRGNRTAKGYIAIFVCLATKAIHIELVSDLTSEAFLAAVRRFISRRGLPRHIYSDNGTTFIGANKELQNLRTLTINQAERDASTRLVMNGIQWHFIPPAAPHFGGLWEAGVKSIKYHLKRIVGDTNLTFEELSTLLAQIEACLNSRPLIKVSNDVDDTPIITPGHFLIGSALNAVPEPCLDDIRSYGSRWRLLQKMTQDFWKIWSTEYLSHLQQRVKWKGTEANIEIGDIVLVKEDRLPPTNWLMGRITETHPGKDNHVRAATIYCNKKYIKRPITKLCPLPIEDAKSQPCEIQHPKSTVNVHLGQSHSRSKNWLTTKSSERMNQVQTTTHINESPHTLRRKNKPTCRLSPLRWLLFTSMVMMVLGQGRTLTSDEENDPVKITPFKNRPGIYFEKIGSVNLIVSDWKIIVYYDMTNYWREFEGFQELVKDMNDFCKMKSNVLIHNIVHQFNHQLTIIKSNNDLLLNQGAGNSLKIRSKRSPFDFIGTVANKLFGILDESYAEHYEQQIQETRSNENHLLELIKNQTSVAESTNNILQKNTETITAQLQAFQNDLENLKSSAIKSNNQNDAEQEFLALSAYATLAMLNYQQTQNSLLNILTDLHHAKINPLVITPGQLRSQLTLIRSHLPPKISVAGEETHSSLLGLYKLLTAKARITERNIIFDIRVPLVNTEDFDLFKVIPVPTPHKNEYVFIEPSLDYLTVNLLRESYYRMTREELSKCTRTSERYLCQQQHPMFNRRSNVSRCELDLLTHAKELSSSCKLRSIKPSPVWIQLNNGNSWIYVLDRMYTFNVICGRQVREISIQDDGILTLQQNCILQQNSMTISSYSSSSSSINAAFIPVTNITEVLSESPRNTSKPLVIPHVILKSEDEDIKVLTKWITDIKNQEHLPAKPTVHPIHHGLNYSLIAALFILMMSYVMWRYCKRSKRNMQIQVQAQELPPIPADRRFTATDFNVA